jgi:hypothetical protein
MFPSCVQDEYGVSKTFLILYRNEEIILDDQIIFKISTILNPFEVLILTLFAVVVVVVIN